jgi:RecA-family ATPase
VLPFLPAHRLAVRAEEQRWLIEALWADEAVGIVGGEPKCCKSFLALDLAVAVATGRPCLRHFPVPRAGRVLLFAAEDALHVVRQRLEGICRAAGTALAEVDVQVITAPSVRLDLEADRKALAETIAELQPKLLVLDPFVRLHRIDENVSGEVAPLLAFLRELQRRHHVAVLLVHHARKGGSKLRAGQALRGSSEFHAWGDSNLYLRRLGEQLTLSVEHRAAASIPNISLQLAEAAEAVSLAIAERRPTTPSEPTLAQRVEHQLATATSPLSAAQLRELCHSRKATMIATLAAMASAGRITKSAGGYCLPHR